MVVRHLAFILPLLFGLTFEVYGQGKIAGRVTDARTGESLIGVNVLIESTQQGTITDLDGNYVILNVRSGEYTVLYSYVGYKTQRVEGLRVITDQTTRLDVSLTEETIQGQEVIVQAERPLIQRDLTSSRRTVVAEEIQVLPVEDFFGVLATQAGVTQGAGGELHIRGGRSNEIGYLVNGMSVANPFNTNGLATEVATNAIEEMTVVSGAFNAEYGQAMSGIVNIVTREGGTQWDASVSGTVGDWVSNNSEIWGMPDGIRGSNFTLQGTLGGPLITNKLRVFAAARYDDDDGFVYGFTEHLPTDSANFNTGYWEIHGRPWWEYRPDLDQFPDLTEEEIAQLEELPEVPGEAVPMASSTTYNITGKVTYRFQPQMKLAYTLLQDGSDRMGSGSRSADFSYRYNPLGLGNRQYVGRNHQLEWTHTLNVQTFYQIRLSYGTTSYERFTYEDPEDPRYVKDIGGTGQGTVVGFPGSNFYFSGNQKAHIYEDTKSFRGRVDLTRQFGRVHEAKIGIDWRLHELERQNFDVLFDGNVYRQPTVTDVNTPSHDFLEGQDAQEFSAYIQDKLEFENFIMNVGLRFDRFSPNGTYIPNLRDPWEDQQNRVIEQAEASPKNMWSPRLGVSFPITARGIIHFSYGHFYQMPTLRQMYINPEFEFGVGSAPTFGNADLRPEHSVSYEFGLQQQLSDQVAFDLTGFFRDIRDYRALQNIQFSTIPGEDSYAVYLNKDYANVKGITFALTKRRSRTGLLSANIDYTFMIAEGNNNDSGAFFFNFLSGREDEFEIVALDWDQTHNLAATISLTRPNNWGMSFIARLASGYPYSPEIIDQNIDLLPNSERKPTLFDVDVRLFKNFEIGAVGLQAFLNVYNLFDRLNERFVFNDTGRAIPGIHDLNDYNTRPHFYSAPRQIRIGLALNLQ
jgi:outer membrane receptor protein involved in Fe transport